MSLLGHETPEGVSSPSASFRLLLRLREEGGGLGKLDREEGLRVRWPATSGVTAEAHGLHRSLKRLLRPFEPCIPQAETPVPSPPPGCPPSRLPEARPLPRSHTSNLFTGFAAPQPCAHVRPPHLPGCTPYSSLPLPPHHPLSASLSVNTAALRPSHFELFLPLLPYLYFIPRTPA